MSTEDDELVALMADALAHDKSLTTEERNEQRRANRLDKFRRNLARLSKYIADDSPDCIIASAVFNLYRVAWSLWEDAMAREDRQLNIELARKYTGRCAKCGNELPMPFDAEEWCPDCLKEQEQFVAEMEKEHA